MKKIPTIFKRNPENMATLTDESHDDCLWVFNGEGAPTRKYDGTSCLIREGKLYKRREVKKGKPEPDDFELETHDQTTGKKVGWVPVTDSPDDKWHNLAFRMYPEMLSDGTYELIGPKIQGNPEKVSDVQLIKHSDAETYIDVPTDLAGLKVWLDLHDIEGLVWHHPDGRMAKIKKKDFQLKR